MMSKDNDWYMVQIWLDTNERSQAWLSRRLEVHEVSINRWKRAGKIPTKNPMVDPIRVPFQANLKSFIA